MALKDDLIKQLPQVYQNSDVMKDLCSAFGEVLDGFKENIENFDNYTDYQKLDTEKVENLAKQFDINFLRNISLERKKKVVSEAIDLYRTNGTEKSLRRVFSLIGWKVNINYTWVVDPTEFSQQSTYTFTNDIGGSYEVSEYEIVYGEEANYNGEIFVDVYNASGDVFKRYPIFGEIYNTHVSGARLIKVPYVAIEITAEDYDLFTQDYTDQTTNKVYSYTEQENYKILEDIKKFFLDQSRPSHVAIFQISTPFSFSDPILYGALDDPTIETVNAGATYDGTLVYGGFHVDRYIQREQMGGFEYGTSTMGYYGIGTLPPEESFSVTLDNEVGPTKHWLLRENTTIDLYVPYDASIDVFVSKQNGREIITETPEWELVENFTSIATNDISVGTGALSEFPISTLEISSLHHIININNYMTMRFNVKIPPSEGAITATITYNG